ncbi:MAG: bifunctional sugar-1-phosphate nucleotidylyltransferase/acetyltransferase [Candidatus Thorarchaeota archaeon]
MKKAALMAAGNSTRMLPLTANRPKHLLPIAGSPLIFHTLRALRDAGITETLIIYGYRGDLLREAIDAADWGKMSISYVEQTERKGTAHAAGHASDFAGEDDIIVMNGDVLTAPDTFTTLIDFHRGHDFGLSLTVLPVEDPSAYGIVEVKGNRAVDLIEKPRPDQMVSNLCNMGIYAAGPDLWEAIAKTPLSKRGEYEITDSIMMLIREEKVGVHQIPSWWLDLGKPWDLLEANEKILSNAMKRIEGTVEEGATIKGNTIVEPGALVKSGAYIEGPAYIGPECVIGPNCYIRAYTSLSRKVKIGNAVEIKNSIIMDGTNVGHLSYVGDSIIGMRSNFGAGTITANLRHDNADIKVTVKGERVSSGRRKLGAIIGDDVKTGIGTSISTGIVLHQGARTGVGVIVDRDIPPNTLVIAKQSTQEIEMKPSE